MNFQKKEKKKIILLLIHKQVNLVRANQNQKEKVELKKHKKHLVLLIHLLQTQLIKII